MHPEFRFVSLGGDCQPGFHSRRIMQIQDIPFVFDWLETPIDAAISLIETEFQNFFAPDHLFWQNHGDFWSVTDQMFGVTSNHHFKAGPPDPVFQVTQTFRLLGRRFMAMLRSEMPAIFVRRWIERDGPGQDDAARQLHACIKTFRPDSVLLFLQPQDPRAPLVDEKFISAFNPPAAEAADWAGYTALYNRNFSRAHRLAAAAPAFHENQKYAEKVKTPLDLR